MKFKHPIKKIKVKIKKDNVEKAEKKLLETSQL